MGVVMLLKEQQSAIMKKDGSTPMRETARGQERSYAQLVFGARHAFLFTDHTIDDDMRNMEHAF
jgi:hypothetical protein